jgi:hypothetical protein
MSWISILADIIGIVSAIFAVAAWINTRRISAFQKSEQERLDQKIQIRLLNKEDNKTYIDLPGKMRREELARSEVLGWLGMLKMKVPGSRFGIAYLSDEKFLETMNEIQAASGDKTFVIPCTPAELDQFDASLQKVLDPNSSPIQPEAAQPTS